MLWKWASYRITVGLNVLKTKQKEYLCRLNISNAMLADQLDDLHHRVKSESSITQHQPFICSVATWKDEPFNVLSGCTSLFKYSLWSRYCKTHLEPFSSFSSGQIQFPILLCRLPHAKWERTAQHTCGTSRLSLGKSAFNVPLIKA